ncbi:uncharacterized protein LOC117651533 [Thrips palmi]|uniref:Uncharacterized protein LOC117651533 n=1 Tax=Thrips palmi TaxID=161013 RepID=A0A6P9A237_THRPL|nr:uncharacterized protein LOC117651533 [Thrips palmi]
MATSVPAHQALKCFLRRCKRTTVHREADIIGHNGGAVLLVRAVATDDGWKRLVFSRCDCDCLVWQSRRCNLKVVTADRPRGAPGHQGLFVAVILTAVLFSSGVAMSLRCNICLERFDNGERLPKCLPCGHTECLKCLKELTNLRCPECRRELVGPVDALPNNYFALSFVVEREQQKRADLRLWCQDDGKLATDECVDLGHSVCTLRKLRSEQAAPRLQQLESAASGAREVVQALRDAELAVQAELQQWQGRLRDAERALRRLLAAIEDGTVSETAQPDGLEELQDAASLLQLECTLPVQLRAEDGTLWEAGLQQGGRSLLHPLLLHLHRSGAIAKVGKPKDVAASDDFSPAECRDVSEYCAREDHSQETDDVLRDPHLDKVKKLNGVDCKKRPSWCKVLLQRVAPRVEWLCLSFALREHLDVIHDMPELRFLYVLMAKCSTVAPDLPLQLEELMVVNVPKQHLQSVQRMPNLRKLTLDWSSLPLAVAFPPLPPGHRGLQWLQVYLRPVSTVLSLAKAHAATLQELRILCASEGDSPWHFEDLAEELGRCGLVALRRVVLLRGGAPGFPDNKLPHGKESCRPQKHAVWDSLVAADSKAVRVVTVLCWECDKCPPFPKLGNFTWQEK